MTRTTRYKLGYIGAFGAVGALAIVGIRAVGGGVLSILIVAVLLLVPGRLLGIAYRDLFRGRRLMEMQLPEASIAHTQRFLEYIRQYPGRKRLLWLAWSIYTPDAEAMALNNLGAACLETGDFVSAADWFNAALKVDPQYPLPHYNLAIERALAQDIAGAERHAAEAERLGFRGTRIDAIILEAGSLLARVEGRGKMVVPRGD